MMQCLYAQSQQVLHKASPLGQKPLSISVCCQPPGARHFNSISSRKGQVLLPALCRQRALSPAAMVRLYVNLEQLPIHSQQLIVPDA